MLDVYAASHRRHAVCILRPGSPDSRDDAIMQSGAPVQRAQKKVQKAGRVRSVVPAEEANQSANAERAKQHMPCLRLLLSILFDIRARAHALLPTSKKEMRTITSSSRKTLMMVSVRLLDVTVDKARRIHPCLAMPGTSRRKSTESCLRYSRTITKLPTSPKRLTNLSLAD